MQTPADRDTTPVPNGGAAGVIHDIGYQRYDGSRLGRGYLLRTLFLDTLRGCRSGARPSQIMPLVLFGFGCLPAIIIAVILNAFGGEELPMTYPEYLWTLSMLVSIYVAGQAPQAVSRDLRFRATSLYFSRPLRRGDYVVAKFAAMTAAVLIFTGVPMLILYLGTLLAKLPFWEQTGDVLVGLVGALLTALVLGGISLVIAAITPRRGFGVAAIITVLLVANSVAGVVFGVAQETGRETLSAYAWVLSPTGLVDGVLVGLFDLPAVNGVSPPGTTGCLVYLSVTVLLVSACAGLLLGRYRKVSVS